MDVSRKTVLFYDASASYTHMAECVVPEFAAVKYHVPWEKGFSITKDYIPGMGLPGIERVPDFFDALDGADLVVFSDVGMPGLQNFLRDRGMPVFGSAGDERLERDRWFLKQTLKDLDIDYSEGYLVKGLDQLRKLLQRNDDLYVKFSYFRGDIETYHHENYARSRRKLADWEQKLGPYADVALFLVEPPIEGDCVEVGADPFWVSDGRFPTPMLWGYEDKDAAYAGTIRRPPDRITRVMDKLSGALTSYRGPLSTETRETEDASYLIDLSCRFPEPPSSSHSFIVENPGEMMYGAAIGDPVQPEYKAAYVVEIVLRSEAGAEAPLAFDLHGDVPVRIHGHCIIEGVHYAVSPSEIRECAAACGWGNTLSEASEMALDAAESVKADELEYDAAAIRRLVDTINKGRSLGLQWGAQTGEDHGEESRGGS